MAQDDVPTELSDNAALRYWMAFSFLPENGEEDYETLSNWEIVDIDQARELYTPHGVGTQALDHFAWAIEADHCIWAIQREDGPYALLPHLDPGRVLTRMALLRARVRLHDGDHDGAADDLLLGFELGRAFDSDRLLISTLVGVSIESMAVTLTAQHLPSFDDATVRRLATGIDGLDDRPPLSAVIRGERDTFLGWLEAAIEQADADGDDPVRLHDLAPGLGLEQVVGGLALQSIAQWRAWIDETKAAYDVAGRVVDMPFGDYREAIGDFEAGLAESDNPVITLSMPSVAAVRRSYDKSLARLAMLRAMLAIRLADNDADLTALPAMQDPFGDGAFVVINGRGDDGERVYGLRSALADRDGDPVELHTDAPLVGE